MTRRCESCGGTVCCVPGCEASEKALAVVLADSRERWQQTRAEVADQERQVRFVQVGPNTWREHEQDRELMDSKINEALAKAGLPSLEDLKGGAS